MPDDRVETTVTELVDEATGRRMKRIVKVTWVWEEGVSRHHGDGEGWSGWVEWSRTEEVVPAE